MGNTKKTLKEMLNQAMDEIQRQYPGTTIIAGVGEPGDGVHGYIKGKPTNLVYLATQMLSHKTAGEVFSLAKEVLDEVKAEK